MFRKVLIANRGEIALRVIGACRSLGVRSAAVYSEADADALHARTADEAYPCGGPRATESYLDVGRLLAAARAADADAVHPGYGFLSESAAFAEACEAAGLAFIGPPADVIRRMGDKVTARAEMAAAGVPVVPGSSQRLADAEVLEAARSLGFPLMVKASAGGGGRGLRVVADEAALAQAVERARSEAANAFGDDGLYLERQLLAPRHVEVQVMADRHGSVVHCFERDCSVQRRHQKLFEEAPAPGLHAALRAQLGEVAVRAARAVGYEGAGTVEFLLDGDDFYFLEMNTRIQVEHPITEAITGLDLVAEMIRIAAGEPLSFAQQQVQVTGHAVEARIYAENPAKRFLPSPGTLEVYRAPLGEGIRVDSGVEQGSRVTVHYDPLLAKLIAHGADRAEALARLGAALDAFEIEGIHTSLPFHRWLLAQPDFQAGAVHTKFVEDTFHAEALP